MANNENDRMTDFIIRYKKAFTREECREIIEHIDFLGDNSLLFPQEFRRWNHIANGCNYNK